MESWTDARLAGARYKLEKATAMVSALCQPRGTEGHRDWIMSIPVRLDYDPDVVIATALADLADALTEIRRLKQAVEDVRVCIARVEIDIPPHEDTADWLAQVLQVLVLNQYGT